MTPSDQELLQTRRHDKGLETAYPLTQRFRQMIRRRTATALDPWRADGLASARPALVTFAHGLPRERSAVQGALILSDSHGQVEGQITTVTRLKRQSYGRGQRDLLRQRMLHAA